MDEQPDFDAEAEAFEHEGLDDPEFREVYLRALQRDAWDDGYRAGVRVGESGYVAGTSRHLDRAVNPYGMKHPSSTSPRA